MGTTADSVAGRSAGRHQLPPFGGARAPHWSIRWRDRVAHAGQLCLGGAEAQPSAAPHGVADRRDGGRVLEPGVRPDVSVVIPVKNSQRTIRSTVVALLAQDYPALQEVIVVGDVGDQTWQALADITDPRMAIIEHEEVPGKREPATKRDVGLRKARGQILALVDSDINMDRDWLSRGVALLNSQHGGIVCGGMRAATNTFWGRFVDTNTLAAKTPRVPKSYRVTVRNFGRHGRKPPITANVLMARAVYDDCPMDDSWGFGYEDYEWFWRVVRAGHKVLYAAGLDGAHHHRQSFRSLVREYQVSAHGCANFIHAHPHSPLARKRRRQATLLPPLAAVAAAGTAAAIVSGYQLTLLATASAAAVGLVTREVAIARRLEAAGYVVAGLALGGLFVFSLGWQLVRSARMPVPYPSWDRRALRLVPYFSGTALPRRSTLKALLTG
jgi:GT2 family glycosyltransferase